MEPDAIVGLISRVREKANEIIAAELRARGVEGLAPSHGSILVHLYRFGSLPMSRLAALIGRKKNTVTTLVRKLERLGYVRSGPDSQDNRVTMVELTDKGRRFRTDFEEVSRILLERVWGDMPRNERVDLVGALERVLTNLG